MSQAKITKKDVAFVRAKLIEEGKRPTIEVIRAALGSQGSSTTIHQFKKELDEEELAAKDSPQALDSFRAIWSQAVQVGRLQRDAEVQELRETIEALSSDSQRFGGEATACRMQVAEVVQKLEETTTRLNRVSDELARAREIAERNATKLVDGTERHHQQMESMRELSATQQTKTHDLELKLARAEAKLEVAQASLSVGEEANQGKKTSP